MKAGSSPVSDVVSREAITPINSSKKLATRTEEFLSVKKGGGIGVGLDFQIP